MFKKLQFNTRTAYLTVLKLILEIFLVHVNVIGTRDNTGRPLKFAT